MKAKPIIILLIFSMLSIAWFNPKADKIKAGNRLYQEGKYDEAMDRYTDVLVEVPKSPVVQYNIGASAYKKGDYERAVEAYTKSLLADYPALEDKGHFSVGNCKYKQGERMANKNLTGAIAHYREALESYKRAIDLNSKNMDAKFNYEVVQRKIKELEDRQQQQQQNQQQNQDTNQQNERKQEQQEENPKQEESREADTQREQQQNQEDQRGTSEKEDDEQNASPQNSGEKGEMTKAEALRLLDALKSEEQHQLILRHKRGTSLPEDFKDW